MYCKIIHDFGMYCKILQDFVKILSRIFCWANSPFLPLFQLDFFWVLKNTCSSQLYMYTDTTCTVRPWLTTPQLSIPYFIHKCFITHQIPLLSGSFIHYNICVQLIKVLLPQSDFDIFGGDMSVAGAYDYIA